MTKPLTLRGWADGTFPREKCGGVNTVAALTAYLLQQFRLSCFRVSRRAFHHPSGATSKQSAVLWLIVQAASLGMFVQFIYPRHTPKPSNKNSRSPSFSSNPGPFLTSDQK
jgi:hypothetical protein